jgi:hypothetical protein
VQALVSAINSAPAKVTAALAAPLSGGSDASWTPELFMDAVLDELGAGETVPPPVPRLDRIAPNTFNLMCIPDAAWTTGMQEAIFTPAHKFCHDRQAFLLVDPPPPRAAGPIPDGLGGGPPDLRIDEVGQFQNQQKLFNRWANNVLGPNNVSGATYYPWVQIPDPANDGLPRLLPPSGTVAGLYAATDKARGVWKAPAGIAPGLANVHGLADTLDDETNGALNVQGLNCLRTFPVWQNVSWGARTLAGNDMAGSQFKYVSARRLANYIELTLKQSLKWAVFEPNEAPLWASIVAEATPFMAGLYASGAFDGPDAKSAYFVACDATTTTEQDRLNGIVNVNVGFQPVDPAEFVVLNVQVGGLAPAASS